MTMSSSEEDWVQLVHYLLAEATVAASSATEEENLMHKEVGEGSSLTEVLAPVK